MRKGKPSSVPNHDHRHHQLSSLPSTGLRQSAASAFLIGRYDAIARAVLLPLFPLILVHRVFFFGVLFSTLRDSSFQFGKRRDLPRTFHRIYMLKHRSLSLILSLTPQGIYVVCHESKRPKLESTKVLPLYLRRNCHRTRRIP